MALLQLPHGWTNVSFGAPDVRLCRVTYQELAGCPPLVVTRSLIVKQDGSWLLNVHSHSVNRMKIPSLTSIPAKLNSDSAALLLGKIGELNTCAGNPDPKFTAIAEAKKNCQFLSARNEVVAYLDSSACVTIGELQYSSTVRCLKCHLLTDDVCCSECTTYRNSLLIQHSRVMKRSSSVKSKKTNFR